MGHLKILVVLLIMSDVCSRIAFARSTKRVEEDYGTDADDDSETEYYEGAEDGDEEEGEGDERGDDDVSEIETDRRDDGYRSSKSRSRTKSQDSRTGTEEAFTEYEEPEPEVLDRKKVFNVESVGKAESSDDLHVSDTKSGNNENIHEEEDHGGPIGYSESMRTSDSRSEVSLGHDDEMHPDDISVKHEYVEKNYEEKTFVIEHDPQHSVEMFPMNPLYSDGNPNDDTIVVQTIDDEKFDFNRPQAASISGQGRTIGNGGSNAGEVGLTSYDEASIVQNLEPVPLSKELEGLVEISPLQSGNNLDTSAMGLGEKMVFELTMGAPKNASSTNSSETSSSNQSKDKSLEANANENTTNQTKVILLGSEIDVKGSGTIRRSAELAAGSEIEELAVEEVKAEPKRQADPIELEKVPAEDATNPCNLPVVTGACKGAFPRFYYSPEVHSCIPFTFTGCGQNANNFETEEDCMVACEANRKSRNSVQLVKKKLEFGSSATGTGIYSRNRVRRKFPLAFCSLELDLGDICSDLKRGLYLEQFFYDSRINQCSDFVYSGCGGNANRFSSMWECTQNCVTAPTTSPPTSAV